ncbi:MULTISPECIES: hypothetical protein [unclassified Streptomyces]|uniref:hypothetical protein n=1 Tax=unclassified Streptomyces TaxID=2593676 RepID=UPI0035DBE5B4
MFRRFSIDTGIHLASLVIDEDATHTAGHARFRAACSCGRLPAHTAGTREEAYGVYLAHAATRVSPPALGGRVAVLVVAMAAVWGACYVAGQILTHGQGLTGTTAVVVAVAAHLTGLTAAFALMVGARRLIAPIRA